MINKKDTLGQIMQNYPEVAPVLAKAGLHCVGCHVSAYESLEDGCLAHGLKEKDILDIIKKSNDVIKKVDSLPEISFTKKATGELEKKKLKEKGKYVRVAPVFDGYDFEVTNKKEKDEIIIDKKLSIIADKRTQRFLKGVVVDYSDKEKDFTAKRK